MTTGSKPTDGHSVEQDAKGQFAESQADGRSSGVASAKPTVITGSEDGTAHKAPPGKKVPANEWDSNFDPGEHPKAG